MKEFYVVYGDNVRKANLRETPKFYIEDANGTKFKKIENQDHLGHYLCRVDKWRSTNYYLYDIGHETPKKLIEKNNRSIFAWKVKKAAEEKISSIKTYGDAVRINEILDLGIEK